MIGIGNSHNPTPNNIPLYASYQPWYSIRNTTSECCCYRWWWWWFRLLSATIWLFRVIKNLEYTNNRRWTERSQWIFVCMFSLQCNSCKWEAFYSIQWIFTRYLWWRLQQHWMESDENEKRETERLRFFWGFTNLSVSQVFGDGMEKDWW